MREIRNQGKFVVALLVFFKRLTPIVQRVFVVVLILYSCSGIYQIQPNERALVKQLGKLKATVHGPGLLIALPKPFSEVIRFETERELTLELEEWEARGDKRESFINLRELTSAESQDLGAEGGAALKMTEALWGDFLDPIQDGYAVTGDSNIVQGLFKVRYKIKQPYHYYATGSQFEKILKDITFWAATHQFAVHSIDYSLTSGRQAVIEKIRSSMQRKADELTLGVLIVGVEMRALAPPKQVLAAFEDVINAKQFAKTLELNALSHQQKVLNKAQSDARRMRSRADAVGRSIVAQAEGEARAFNSFLVEYEKNPYIHTERLYWDSIESVMREVNSRSLLPGKQAKPIIMVEPIPEFLR